MQGPRFATQGHLPRHFLTGGARQQRVRSSRGAHTAGTTCLLQEGCAPRGPPPASAVEEGELIAMSVHMHVGGIRTFGN